MKRFRLAERRKTVGLSQERLAEIVGVDRSTVFRWEAAATDPQPWQRPRLAKALRVSSEELAVLLANVGGGSPKEDDHLDYVLTNPAAVDLFAAASLRQRIERLDDQYDRVLSSSLLALVGQLHGQACYLRLHAGTDAIRREMWLAEAESAVLMGQLTWDASMRRDHQGANVLFERAASAAREIRDHTTEARSYLRRSYVALYGAANPRIGLALTQRAAHLSRGRSNVVTGLAMLHMGEAYAMLGDEISCHRALGLAETQFAGLKPEDPARGMFCPSTYGRLAGSCHLYLMQHAKAESILDSTQKLLRPGKKSASILFGNLSLACIRQRKVDEAAGWLHRAIDVLERSRGGGGTNVVFAAARELRPWRQETCVVEVNDRLLTLMTAA